ncbi:MAG: transglutaminase [Acidobacteria bacterium]|uniref:Transglutaminase n=1 Tax=Candidatus Polarisedimenticola svalbardensis TaxID=2886004 RepID=A0A8J7CDV6_9BACT|nr:transglutaminase [Candidatus Polarisedimenticola svalbardensis]
MRKRDRIMIAVLIVACCALVFYRAMKIGRGEGAGMPVRHYELSVDMAMFGHGGEIAVRSYLPIETGRQSVRDELVSSGAFLFSMERTGNNRLGIWEKQNVAGPQSLVYSCVVRTDARRYELSPAMAIPSRYPAAVSRFLREDDYIQSGSTEISGLLDTLIPAESRGDVRSVLQAIFDYTHEEIRPSKYSGTTDALTCLRLGESSCGGKSRLFVALARAAGFPARPVGGLILKNGTWRAGHIWAEVWVGGHWVPFCPLNGYFAEVPDRYLITYIGDLPQFEHTRDINFRYHYSAKRILAPPDTASVRGWAATFDAPNLWAAFEQVRIPVNLLKIILMVPFGALIVVLCRNIIGVETFGTFMPALIAVAFRDTGLWWGAVLLVTVIGLGAAVRFFIGRFQLLHTPRLAVILTVIVLAILGLAMGGRVTGLVLPTRVSLFPLAILALTVERFSVMLEEDGPYRVATVSLGTLLVAAAAYGVMDWERLQVAVLMFPELLLLVIAAMFVLGRWSGMRLGEYIRFRELPGEGGQR